MERRDEGGDGCKVTTPASGRPDGVVGEGRGSTSSTQAGRAWRRNGLFSHAWQLHATRVHPHRTWSVARALASRARALHGRGAARSWARARAGKRGLYGGRGVSGACCGQGQNKQKGAHSRRCATGVHDATDTKEKDRDREGSRGQGQARTTAADWPVPTLLGAGVWAGASTRLA